MAPAPRISPSFQTLTLVALLSRLRLLPSPCSEYRQKKNQLLGFCQLFRCQEFSCDVYKAFNWGRSVKDAAVVWVFSQWPPFLQPSQHVISSDFTLDFVRSWIAYVWWRHRGWDDRSIEVFLPSLLRGLSLPLRCVVVELG